MSIQGALNHMNLLDLIGNTPIIDLSYFSPDRCRIALFAKAEWLNPGGSIKDRPVKHMLHAALASGELTREKIVLDSSSGNAGISYAMIGAALGLTVSIVIPGNASRERKDRLTAHGATLVETDPLEGYDHALRTAHEIYRAAPNSYFFCDQYNNEHNVLAHYEGTASELIAQVPGAITHFVCGVGTGGSLTGISRRLKEVSPGVRIVGVMPERWPGIEGLKPMGEPEDIVPGIFDPRLVDQWIVVGADAARDCCHELAKQGNFAGQSSGAYLAACLELMNEIREGTVTTLLCDLGERYFSTGLWQHDHSDSRTHS